jgi:hypothetical protein
LLIVFPSKSSSPLLIFCLKFVLYFYLLVHVLHAADA